jgi:hypothetical protein
MSTTKNASMSTTTIPAPCPFVTPEQQLCNAAEIAGAVRLNDIKPIPTKWLWPGVIPLGRVTLLTGDPGAGKSLLTLDVAARVSSGLPWPDSNAECRMPNAESKPSAIPHSALHIPHSSDSPLRAPCSVLLLTSEDDLADTVRPRLEAAGADCDRILAISSVPGEHSGDVPRPFALNRDLKRLANLLDAMPDCRLVIIDPISSFLGTTNEHANADVRAILAALTAIARDRNIAVLTVGHLRKKEGAAIHRTIGSLAFVAGARAVWLVTKDPNDENKRLLLPVKNNLASHATGRAFTIEQDNHPAPTLEWLPDPVEVTADTLPNIGRPAGRPDDERQHAITWLQERLAKGSRAVRDLKEESDAHGISYRTLCRAFRAIGGEAAREAIAPFNRWVWKLPGTTCQNTQVEFWQADNIDDYLAELAKPFLRKRTPTADPTDQNVQPTSVPNPAMPDPPPKE